MEGYKFKKPTPDGKDEKNQQKINIINEIIVEDEKNVIKEDKKDDEKEPKINEEELL